MVFSKDIVLLTNAHLEFLIISDEVSSAVAESGVKDGLVAVITNHTTTGIVVNEGLECLKSDMEMILRRLVPEDLPYAHAHWLPTYGRTSANVTGHLCSMLTGNSCMFPIKSGKINLGEAQEIYLAEFDGPQSRRVTIQILGE